MGEGLKAAAIESGQQSPVQKGSQDGSDGEKPKVADSMLDEQFAKEQNDGEKNS